MSMHTKELLEQLNQELLDKLYGFSYARCQNQHEAEDLCSEIMVQLVKSIQRGIQVEKFEPFCWKVARNVYADFCEKRKKQQMLVVTQEEFEQLPMVQVNPVEDYLTNNQEKEQMEEIIHQIAFLGKMYREVMVQYYLEEKKVSEIAQNLGISETTVKQRLFAARNTIKNEMEQGREKKMPVLLKPIYMFFEGTGNPVGNDPTTKAERVLSQMVLYLCRKEEQKASDIAKKLGVPLVYIEDELEILCKGENGTYGLLRKVGKDKYISNIIVLEKAECQEIRESVSGEIYELIEQLKVFLQVHGEQILGLNYYGTKFELPYIFWTMVVVLVWNMIQPEYLEIMEKEYFPNVTVPDRPYTSIAIIGGENIEEEMRELFYGADGIDAKNICGYQKVSFYNTYGKRVEAKFHCGENIALNQKLLLTIRSAKGLAIDSLTEEEKEYVAKAIADGYIIKKENMLYPGIVTVPEKTHDEMVKIAQTFIGENIDILKKMYGNLAKKIKKVVPRHLIPEYKMLIAMVGSQMTEMVIEEGIRQGILSTPVANGNEGTLLVIEE
mgnify:FL=1